MIEARSLASSRVRFVPGMVVMLSRAHDAGAAGDGRELGQDGVMTSRSGPGTTIPFAQSERSTVGIEWELALVDQDSGDLRQVAQTVLDAVTPSGAEQHP